MHLHSYFETTTGAPLPLRSKGHLRRTMVCWWRCFLTSVGPVSSPPSSYFIPLSPHVFPSSSRKGNIATPHPPFPRTFFYHGHNTIECITRRTCKFLQHSVARRLNWPHFMQLIMNPDKQLPIRCNPPPVPGKQCNRSWFFKNALTQQQPSRGDSIAIYIYRSH
jgi:hypothetical protein